MATCKDCLHFNDCLSYGKTRYYYRMKNKEALEWVKNIIENVKSEESRK